MRFHCGEQLASYVGLVPEEKSSGDRRRLGHISKQGNVLLCFLLVEAAQVTVRSQQEWCSKFFHLALYRCRSVLATFACLIVCEHSADGSISPIVTPDAVTLGAATRLLVGETVLFRTEDGARWKRRLGSCLNRVLLEHQHSTSRSQCVAEVVHYFGYLLCD